MEVNANEEWCFAFTPKVGFLIDLEIPNRLVEAAQ
jgi:hypothetical protein